MNFVLAIVAMFKNESSILESWIEHYIKEGVQHFYLIDNGSTDDYQKILNPYMDIITLVKDPDRSSPTPQTTNTSKIKLSQSANGYSFAISMNMSTLETNLTKSPIFY